MEFVKRQLNQVKMFLGSLSADTRYLIGCLAVIIVGVLGFAALYAGEGGGKPLRVPGDRLVEAQNALDMRGIDYTLDEGEIFVPAEQHSKAFAALVESEVFGQNIGNAFDSFLQEQDMWASPTDKKQRLLITKQSALSVAIASMSGVKSAQVILDVPENRGFGDNAKYGSASVNVVMDGGGKLDKNRVRAMAALVSGAIAEIRIEDVNVIDANNGTSSSVDDDSDIMTAANLEWLQGQEKYYQKKIESALRDVYGVIVAVNVQTEGFLEKRSEQFDYMQSEPLKSTHTREESRTQTSRASEPGVRPNVGMSTDSAGGQTTVEEVSEESTEFERKSLTGIQKTVESGYKANQINVTIGVPRSYFVALYNQFNGRTGEEAEADPDADELQTLIDRELQNITERVEPLIKTEETGIVRARMAPDPMTALAAANSVAETEDMIEQISGSPLLLVGLSVISIALMAVMFRSAVKQPKLPTVEELAGVPPSLPSDEDIIGEAAESDGSMTGFELDEAELESRKIAEQINDLIKSNPNEAAALFNRWLKRDDY